MEKDVEVLIIIHCDQEPNKEISEKDIDRIKLSLTTRITGIIDIYQSPRIPNSSSGEADIIATALWEESEIGSKQAEIEKIEGVKKVEIRILASA